MKKILQLLILCMVSASFAQNIDVEIQPVGFGMYSGSGSDCGDCSSSPDPYVYAQFKHSGTGTFTCCYQRTSDNVGCDNYGTSYGGYGTYSGSNITATNSAQIQMTARESDGGICTSDDGNCGGYNNPSSGSNNLTFRSYGICNWTGDFSSQRENCISDGSTNDYRVYWRLRWVYNASSLTAANAGGGTPSISNTEYCDGGNPANITCGAGQTAFSSYQWQQSVNGGGWTDISGQTSQNMDLSTISVSGGGNLTTYDFRRLTRYITNFSCGQTDVASGTVRINVYQDPTAPTATKVPNVTDVCAGQTLTLNSQAYGTYSGKSCAFEYRYSTNGGGTYTSWSASVPNFAAVTGTNIIEMRVSGGCADGCNASPATQFTWTVGAQPTITTQPSSPNAICPGGNASVTISTSGGGGTRTYQWQYLNGSFWNNVADGTPASITYSTNPSTGTLTVSTVDGATSPGSFSYRCNVSATGTGCATVTSSSGGIVTINPEGSAPTATQSPSAGALCPNQTLTLTSPTLGSGGAGSTSFEYSTTSATSGFSTTVPSLSATSAGTYNLWIRTAYGGLGCNNSSATNYAWTVSADPSAPTATQSPVSTTVCAGQMLTLTGVTAGGGGAGTCVQHFRFNNGSGYGAWSTSVPNFASVAGTNSIQVRTYCNGSNCDSSNITTYSWTVNAQPSITANPTNATICLGGAYNPSITVAGGISPTIQWQYNSGSWNNVVNGTPASVTYSGATTSTLSADNFTGTGSFDYRAIVTDLGAGCNDPVSNTGTVIVVTDPIFTSSPAGATICQGGSHTMTVSSTGGAGVTYQWQYYNGSTWNTVTNGTPTGASYSGGATASMTVSGISIIGSYVYRCQITDAASGCDDPASNTATIVVNPDPIITAHPASGTICQGGSFNMITTVTGGAGLTYQWQYYNGTSWNNVVNGTPSGAIYAGAINNSLTISGASIAGNYSYRCIVNDPIDGCDDLTSNTAILTVNADPIFTSAPASATICQGGSHTLTVSSSGGVLPTYSWEYYNGVSWAPVSNGTPTGATYTGDLTNSMTVTGITSTGSHSFRCQLTDGGSGCSQPVSNVAILTINPQVTITANPSDVSVCISSPSASFTSGFTGGVTAAGQWQYYNGASWVSVSNGSPAGAVYTGATDSTLNVLGITATGTYSYRYQVTDLASGCSDPASNTANLTIYGLPTSSNAGPDQFSCYGTSVTLNANNPTIGSGVWSWSGPGTVTYVGGTNATQYNAQVSFSVSGVYVGTWTITSGSCGSSSDAVSIHTNNPSTVTLVDGATGVCTITDTITGFVHFFDSNGNAILSVNGNGYNLGVVSVQANIQATAPNVTITAPGTSCIGQTMAYMRRNYRITCTDSSWFGNPVVTVRLYFTGSDLSDLITKSRLNTGSCSTDDDVTNIGDVKATKYRTGVAPGTSGGVFLDQVGNGSGFGANYIDFMVGSFSDFYLHGSYHNAPLPVTLTSLTAEAVTNPQAIQVKWTTAMEINNKGFEVQRKSGNGQFTTIGWVDGAGNSTVDQNYTFNDVTAIPGVYYYYRLHQIDFDGQHEFSKIVSALIPYDMSDLTVGTFVPNPSSDLTTLEITSPSDQTANISVYSSIGEWVFSFDKAIAKGSNKLVLSTDTFAAGTYFVHISAGDKTITRRLVVSK